MDWTPEEIKRVRHELGLTQEEFAKRLGYSRQATVSDLETGKQRPSGAAQQVLELLEKQVDSHELQDDESTSYTD